MDLQSLDPFLFCTYSGGTDMKEVIFSFFPFREVFRFKFENFIP